MEVAIIWLYKGLVEDITGLARTDLYTEITMTNFGQNPVQATKTNKQFPQLKRGMDSHGGDCIQNITLYS